MDIDWNNVKLVIFDVDGTLYRQSSLRKKMGRALLSYYLLRPWKAYDLQIIRVFRQERELMNLNPVPNIDEAQYQICAGKLGITAERVKQLIEKWMYKAPLQHLNTCSYRGIQDFFNALKQQEIKIAIYSDYPATEKLQAMGLEADMIVSSTDKHVDALKPDPSALFYIMNKFNFKAENCLFVGDRDELDGECARKAGMPYYILSKEDKQSDIFYARCSKNIGNKEQSFHSLSKHIL